MAKPSVLVVDDEEPVRLILRVNLEASGFRVVEAPDGAAAITAATRDAPDLVVLDLMMPGIDGWAVLAGLRTAFAHESRPVIILSASVSPDNQQRARDEGASFLAKPFEVEQLVELAQELTRDRRSKRTGTETR